MAGGMDWFRWHHGSVTDPKFGLVAKKAGARLGDVLAVWAFVLESASSNETRGTVGAIDAESLEFLLGLDQGAAYRILDAMTQRGLLGAGGVVQSWERRQPKRERDDDNSTARVQAFRQKQRHETPGNATERQETPRGEESREEQDQCTHTPLARDWKLPPVWAAWAVEQYPHWTPATVDLIASQFADHWRASGGASSDWGATWRKWCRDDLTQSAHRPKTEARDKGPPAATVPSNGAAQTASLLEAQKAHAAKATKPPASVRQLMQKVGIAQ